MPRGICGVVVFVLLSAPAAVAQLPPEILVDQYLLEADQRMAQKDAAGTSEAIQRVLALQKEHDLTLPVEFHFKSAQVAFAAGSFPSAMESVNQYLLAAGRDGKFYQKALELLLAIKAAADRTPCAGQPKGAECWLELGNQAECYVWTPQFDPYKVAAWTGECSGGVAQGRGTLEWTWDVGDTLYKEAKKAEKAATPSAPQLPAGTPALFQGESTCAGQTKGASCWMELANQPGCYLWNPNLQVDETVTWTGECIEGLAQGTGTRKWVYDSGKKTSEGAGQLRSGKEHGQWVGRKKDGSVEDKFYVEGEIVGSNAETGVMEEGLLVNGKKHGNWILRGADGDVEEGPFVEGKMQGLWTFRWTDGSIEERPIVDGKIHGQLTGRNADGDIWEVAYVEGKKHGQYTGRTAEGKMSWEGLFVEGQQHGAWTEGAWRGIYVEGKKHGRWVRRDGDGQIVERGSYVEDKRDGTWTILTRSFPGRENERSVTYDRSSTYDRSQVDPIRPEMVEIPGGSFRMGCLSGPDCDDDEHPVHEVRVEAFELGKYEVTFEEYDRFTAATGREPADNEGWGRGRRPVINVSWEDAVAYTKWLSGQTGERYRLPTEAEWEYAARAGSVTAYSWGNEIGSNRANCDDCGSQWDGGQTAPVGSFGANSWGLYDMHGNVWEWVQDCWNESYQGAPANGSAWESGDCTQRVLRGGSWVSDPRDLRSAYRYRFTSTFRNFDIGFRVARTITP